MPLDPAVKSLLEDLATSGAPPVEEGTPEAARRAMDATVLRLGPPIPLPVIDDRRIPVVPDHFGTGGVGTEIPVRIYRPNVSGAVAAFVFLHGGGWTMGGIHTHDSLCRTIATAARCVVISVDYRLAPEHRFPAALGDAYASTCWVRRHANELGIDAARIAIGGDSAGGNLATATCLLATERGDPVPALQILIYPATDMRFDTRSYRQYADGYMLTRNAMIWYWKLYRRTKADADIPYVSPLRAPDLSHLPPALIITAEYDPLRDEAEEYASRLQEATVPVKLMRCDGMIHGFLRLLHETRQSKTVIEQIARKLNSPAVRFGDVL